ncbi:MAG: hydroxymethylbilane synthase [Pseudolysinimonas sp.]
MKVGGYDGALALAYAQSVASSLGAELVALPSGDDQSSARLRSALLAGELDAVVQAYPDLPTERAVGVAVAAVPRRADPRDALCARDGLALADLPAGARVGVEHPLRRAQLLSRRPDLHVVELVGDVDTLLGRVGSDDTDRHVDAVILAAAALERLGRLDAITKYFGIDPWPTAPGQGALAVETRTGDEKSVAKVNHTTSRLTAEAERAVLAMLEVSCTAPMGAHAILDEGLLFLSVRVYREDGSEQLTSSHALYPDDSADPIGELAKRVTDELLASGAAELAPLRVRGDIPGRWGTE